MYQHDSQLAKLHKQSKQASFCKTRIPPACDNDMIVKRDSDDLPGFDKLARYLDVLTAWLVVSAGVIVHDDNGRSKVIDR
jgi:hypothetical protein